MIDTASETWREIRKRAEQRIEEMRDKLERETVNDTIHVHRGRIAELRDLIEFAEPRKAKPQIAVKPDY